MKPGSISATMPRTVTIRPIVPPVSMAGFSNWRLAPFSSSFVHSVEPLSERRPWVLANCQRGGIVTASDSKRCGTARRSRSRVMRDSLSGLFRLLDLHWTSTIFVGFAVQQKPTSYRAARDARRYQLSSKARVRNQCSSASPPGLPSRSHSA
jgi:hypothetical protein